VSDTDTKDQQPEPVSGEIIEPDDQPKQGGLLARLFGGGREREPDDLRGSLLRPNAKRDAAIGSLTRGFDTLTGLMSSIQSTMEANGQTQRDLLDTLQHLPGSVEEAAKANKIHGETLLAIRDQIGQQGGFQEKLGDILGSLTETGDAQRKGLETLQERVEAMREADSQMADNLGRVGSTMDGLGGTLDQIGGKMGDIGNAMGRVTESSHGTAQVLDQIRTQLDARTTEIESQMKKQASKFSLLLVLSLLLSTLALASVAAIGWLILERLPAA
jgi:archaellum component FlaC